MVYKLTDRLDHLAQRMKDVNAEDITIIRGTSITPRVTATPVLLTAQEIMPGVSVTRVEYQEWGIDVDIYRFDGQRAFPQIGDTYNRKDGSTYRVISMGQDEPPYRYTTNKRNRFLILTEMITSPVEDL